MAIEKPKNFQLFKLVDEVTYNKFGERAWMLLDPRALKGLQLLRDRHGKATVNDWYWGGPRQFAGFRPPSCEIGADYSQHK